MNKINHSTRSCRYCRFYDPEGHRGGNCELLNVMVQGHWTTCPLAQDAFAESKPPSARAYRNVSISSAGGTRRR